MQHSHQNHLVLVLLIASSYLSCIHAQTGCVPTDICMSSSGYGSQQYRCDDGKAVLVSYSDTNCSDMESYEEHTNYTCTSSTPCTDYMHLRIYQEPTPEWSWPNNTDEGTCASFYGATTFADDINYYNFTVTEYSTLTIDSCGSPYDTYLYFLTADGSVISECDDCGECGVQTILTVYNVAPGDYLIGVGGFSSNFGQYRVAVYCEETNFIPQSTYDPNPTWSLPESTEEGSCGTFVGATRYANDVDYYDFTVTDYSTIIIDSCASSFDTYLYFETADGRTIRNCDDCGDCGVKTVLTVYNVAPGDYQIGIGGFSTRYGNYVVTVYCDDNVFLPQTTNDYNYPYTTDDYTNPTYSFPQTTDLYPTWSYPTNTEEGTCGTFYGATTREYEIDYYDFTVTEYSTIIIDSCASTLDTYLYFLTADGTLISEADYTGHCGVNERLTVNNVAPGQYYIGIGGFSTNYGAYAVTVYCDDDIFIPETTYDSPVNTQSFPTWSYQTTNDYPDNTDTDTDSIDNTYALNEDICDSDIYREVILPVGCVSTGDGESEFSMCSLEGVKFYRYQNNDCSGEPIEEEDFLEGCWVDGYGDTLNLDIIQCQGVNDVDTTSTAGPTETTEDVVVTDAETREETSTTSETTEDDETQGDGVDGVDGFSWMIATGVLMGMMILFE